MCGHKVTATFSVQSHGHVQFLQTVTGYSEENLTLSLWHHIGYLRCSGAWKAMPDYWFCMVAVSAAFYTA